MFIKACFHPNYISPSFMITNLEVSIMQLKSIAALAV